jgi:ribonuclease HI
MGIPVQANDATRTESLGPALLALLLNLLPKQDVHLYGDSQVVVDSLNRATPSTDVYIYNCSELCKDLLKGWNLRVTWIPRSQNETCDQLAKQATITRAITCEGSGLLMEQFTNIAEEFTFRFGNLLTS